MTDRPSEPAAEAQAWRAYGLADLIAQAVAKHAPVAAAHNAQASRAATDAWLEGLETYTGELLGPLVERILHESNPPPELQAMIDAAVKPKAQFGAALQQIFVYGLVSQILGVAVGPFTQGLVNELWPIAVQDGIRIPLSAANIATTVARGLGPDNTPTVNIPDWAYKAAGEQGVSPEDLNLLASTVGLPPALQELFELLRRGEIDLAEVEQGLREGDFRDDWIARTTKLAHSWLTPDNFVRAAVQEQMAYSDAEDWANKTGLDTSTAVPVNTGSGPAQPNLFGLAYSIAGRPPGPVELGHAALRGFIPWEGLGADALTFQQGIAESDIKTKWTPILKRLAEYFPPPREIGVLLEHGAITDAQAVMLWQAQGVPQWLAEGYRYQADQQHIGQDKLLAKGDIKTAYLDGILTREQAKADLELLGERDGVADEVLAILDYRRELSAINALVKRLQSLFVSHRLSPTNAVKGLLALGVSDEHALDLLRIWEAVRVQPVRVPSPEQIAKAVKYETLTLEQAIDELEQLGYERRDAEIVLTSYMETKIAPLAPGGKSIVDEGTEAG